MATSNKADAPVNTEPKRRRQALMKAARAAETRTDIPDLSGLGFRLKKAAEILNSLDPGIRPRKASGDPGRLLMLPPGLPVLVLPDLHTRAGLLRRALRWTPPDADRPLVDLLSEDRAALLLLGDLFHSEGIAAPRRWQDAYREYLGGFAFHEAMDQEMGRGLRSLNVLAQAVDFAPGRVLCLKGNHDNFRNREGFGDHGFYKFADEGAMCAAWLQLFSDADFRGALADFEDALPLAAVGCRFVASHAEPAFPLAAEEIVEGAPETVEALTWTANDQSLPYSVEHTLRSLLGAGGGGTGVRWLSGHRPVEGRYALRAGGLLVQIHAPFSFQGAWVRPDRPFDPDTDVLEL